MKDLEICFRVFCVLFARGEYMGQVNGQRTKWPDCEATNLMATLFQKYNLLFLWMASHSQAYIYVLDLHAALPWGQTEAHPVLMHLASMPLKRAPDQAQEGSRTSAQILFS